ncbi:hypothetical protein FE88_08105 [Azospirillum brasilense]|uniref:hypothetical protein n=1 Tax=Azospirillum phage Cd TaxID=467481 RepID=UPI000165BD83|nr:hypothetical protein APCd_gp91 [Azospirillum phage Cd]OPH16822.1 hypothetical protein FE89_02355 [Azospirillum brasilense]OPH21629.1 hypothetical protein FE88_08105 [Azospirillum brasilense]PWC93057.1 hypothetical protein AEJ54_14170 [Azospirillum sp. Sp 7]CAO99417.1 hypothetical protein [Azospirillum phage Cd]
MTLPEGGWCSCQLAAVFPFADADFKAARRHRSSGLAWIGEVSFCLAADPPWDGLPAPVVQMPRKFTIFVAFGLRIVT